MLAHELRLSSLSSYPTKRLSLFALQVIHYDDVIMTMLASQITSLTVVYSIVHSGVNQRKHQSSASLAFVREIHRGPVNFPHKWPVTRKMFPFDDVIMCVLLSVKDIFWLPLCCPIYWFNIFKVTSLNIKRNEYPTIMQFHSRAASNEGQWAFEWIQWNMSVMTTAIIKFITCDLFSNVF